MTGRNGRYWKEGVESGEPALCLAHLLCQVTIEGSPSGAAQTPAREANDGTLHWMR
jgi:hypothetical protein